MKSGSWQEREERLLAHIGLYRLSLRTIIERRFFEGGNAGNVTQRLLHDGRIQARDQGFHGRLRYYQLTLGEARRRSLPEERAGAFGGQALHTHLGLLWFCCASDRPRRRLEDEELNKLFAMVPPGVGHCAEGGKDPCIYRMHVVGAKTKIADLIRRLRSRTLVEPPNPALAAWMRQRKYGIAILAESSARCEAIRRALHRAGLPEILRCTVESVPSPLTLHEALHEHHTASARPATP